MWPGDDVGEPCVQSVWGGVDGRVRAVDGDAGFGEVEEGCLLGVFVGDLFEAAEDEGVCGCVSIETLLREFVPGGGGGRIGRTYGS